MQRMRGEAESNSAGLPEGQHSRSVLEQSSLDELIATVELRKESYAAATGEAEFVEQGPVLVSGVPRAQAEHAAACRRELVSIPRRPPWRSDMSPEELAALEAGAFLEWRRGLALAAQEEGLFLTPYERNLDFWRQLWRCLERSDLVVQIVDARDPDFYFCRDLARYIAELGASKRLLLLVNKADFLPSELRERWAEHFAERGIDAVFFSALRELRRQQHHHHPTRATEHGPQREQPTSEPSQEGERDAAEIPVPGLESSDDELNGGDEGVLNAPVQARGEEQAEEPVGREESVEGDAERSEEEVPAEQEEAPLGPLRDDDHGVVDSAQLLEELASRLPTREACEATSIEESERLPRHGTVGFVGYPNVGKSTVINSLVGAKRVGMSSRSGKTKHIQTLELPELNITLCDCPGLVFPSVAASREHLVINNAMPFDDLRECHSPVALILEKMGLAKVLEQYTCSGLLREARERCGDTSLNDARALLTALALSRGHLLRAGVPDEDWAARKVLRDYVSGRLLHCELPPSPHPPADEAGGCEVDAAASVRGAYSADNVTPAVEEVRVVSEDDYSDLDASLQEALTGPHPRNMTKRKMRQLNKQALKGKGLGPAGASFPNGVGRAQK